MGIDRIGSGGPAGPVPDVHGPPGAAGGSAASSVGEAFPAVGPNVRAEGASRPAETSPVADSALERLRSGAIDLEGYIESKVDEATSHLASSSGLAPAAIASIREALRDRIANDPMLADLVQSATGERPGPRDG
jgi:hypothetical protein